MSRELQNILSSGEVTDLRMNDGYTPSSDPRVTTKLYVDTLNALKQDIASLEADVEAIIAAGIPTAIVGNLSGGHYLNVASDGTVTLIGDATAWDDHTFALISNRLESTAGTLQYNYPNLSIEMDRNGSLGNSSDTLHFNIQIPHAAKLNSTAKLHIHWQQPDTSAYEFQLRHRIQENGAEAVATATWQPTTTIDTSIIANNIFDHAAILPGGGVLNQITPLLSLDLTGYNLSDLIQVQLTRSDNIVGTIEAIAVDIHFEIDSFGSSSEYTK